MSDTRGTSTRRPNTANDADLGMLLIQRGIVRPEKVYECLDLQRSMEAEGKQPPRLGELLIAQKLVTQEQLVQSLAQQNKELRYCPACKFGVNVVLRPDVIEYRCNRCQGPLTAEVPGDAPSAHDTSRIVISREPMPPEVSKFLEDRTHRLGKFVLMKLLGTSDVAMVYKAWDTSMSQYVTLKRFHVGMTMTPELETALARVFAEARLAIKLRHASIVAVHDLGQLDSDFYISMEYVEGMTLADLLAETKEKKLASPLDDNPRKFVRILREVAGALQYAHTRPVPVVHGDLKPSNILIDNEGMVHVIDFGLFHGSALKLEDGTEVGGPTCYNAPEQVAGATSEIDSRTDIYAFGVLAYEFLFGEPPFVGTPRADLLRQIVETPQGAYPESEPFRVALQNVCKRCLEKNKAHRPATIGEVVEELLPALKPAQLIPPMGSITVEEILFPGTPTPNTKRRTASVDTLSEPLPIEVTPTFDSSANIPIGIEEPPEVPLPPPAPPAEVPTPVEAAAEGWTWSQVAIVAGFGGLGMAVALVIMFVLRAGKH